MNNFLDAVGAVLYIVFSLATFPLWLLVKFLIGTIVAFRQARALAFHWRRLHNKKKPAHYQPFPSALELAFKRA
jgi:hypothetical protein